MKMKNRIGLKIFIFLMVVIILFVLFVPFYNEVIHPFEGYDKDFIANYETNENIGFRDNFSKFYALIDFWESVYLKKEKEK